MTRTEDELAPQEAQRFADLGDGFPENPDGVIQNIFEVFGELHRHGPVNHVDAYGGFWLINGYDALYEARSWNRFSNFGHGVFPAWHHTKDGALRDPVIHEAIEDTPVSLDPPRQQAYRKILNPHFAPGVIAKLEPSIRAHVTQLIDDFVETGQVEVSHQFAHPLTQMVFWEDIIHLPSEGRALFAEIAGKFETEVDRVTMDSFILEHVIQQRQNEPSRGDVLDALLNAEIESEPLGLDSIIANLSLLLSAGTETTASAMLNGLYYLAEHPELRQSLIDDPDLIPSAVEEFLRLLDPVHTNFRRVTEDTEVCGYHLNAGDVVLLCPGAANRDPAEFPDPDSFDLTRPNAQRHVAFEVGVHRCLGSNLARLELRLGLGEFLRRMPDFHIADGYVYTRDSNHFHRPSHLDLVFAAGKRVGTENEFGPLK